MRGGVKWRLEGYGRNRNVPLGAILSNIVLPSYSYHAIEDLVLDVG